MSNAPHPFLESDELEPTGKFVIMATPVIIGRIPGCQLVLNHPQISRHHARIDRLDDGWVIEDLGSANGTRVNEESITRHSLRDGDCIELGNIRLTFRQPEGGRIRLSKDFPANDGLTIAVPISQLAGSAGVTPETFRRDPAKTVDIVFNAAKSLVGATELEQVLSRVMDLVFEHLRADRGFLMLWDEAEGQLRPSVIKDRTRTDSDEITFSSTIVNKVFNEGVSVLTTDASQDSRFDTQQSIMLQHIRSCMCVPLWDEKKVIGIIYVDCRFGLNVFQEGDLDLLSTIAVISAIAIEQARLNTEIQREKQIRQQLQRYHSPAVVNRIIGSGGDIALRTEEREISVLFADLVGFTTLAENLEPTEVARILNSFFDAMTDVIFNHDGTLDKFIGDAVMAVFGAPLPQPDHAVRAVRAAVGMFEALDRINAAGSLPFQLQMRIGINSGRAVAGDIGSVRRLDYTVLGSTVNIASRIESSVTGAGELVIGQTTRQLIGDLFPVDELGAIPLRGLSTPLNLYRVKRPPNSLL